ncbi:hypothetical protein K7C98_24030 [Nannocystis pusilla]|uniref:Uncharacterized protein n=1 Tax=Nannocystis pusilla TaxID=889268 RepID=A0ABS7TW02_9BACT|nr:hypothetical protein [Nannocystis pusilla]
MRAASRSPTSPATSASPTIRPPHDLWLVDTRGGESLDLVILNTGSDGVTISSGAACQPRAPLLGQRREHPLRRAK